MLSDLTVTRVAEQHFQVMANGPLDTDRLLREAPEGVRVRDVTGGWCCIGLWGPKAREVLQPLTRTDFSKDALKYFRAQPRLAARHPGPRAAAVVRRRARVRDLHDRRPRPGAVGPAVAGRAGARRRRRRPQRLQQPAAGEGLPALRHRHDLRARPVRGRARLRRPPGQGRVRRPRSDRGPLAGDRHPPADLPGPGRPGARRPGQGAGARRTAHPPATSPALPTATPSAAPSPTPGCRRSRSARPSRSSTSAGATPPPSAPSRWSTRPCPASAPRAVRSTTCLRTTSSSSGSGGWAAPPPTTSPRAVSACSGSSGTPRPTTGARATAARASPGSPTSRTRPTSRCCCGPTSCGSSWPATPARTSSR